MTVLCVIAARAGSRGLPGKNLRPLLDKPPIAWSIEQALATAMTRRGFVNGAPCGTEFRPAIPLDRKACSTSAQVRAWQLNSCNKFSWDDVVNAIGKQVDRGRYRAAKLFGDGKAGERIADRLAICNLKIQKRIVY